MNYFTATYDPADNKLRLRSATRFDTETYARIRAAGFIWAAKQDLFVAPKWTPEREDLLLELAEEIGDEDTSLVERAENRADMFDTYADHRERDAISTEKAVDAIASGIPLGQPILIGHHSQRRAERDAEKIQNGLRKAASQWATSAYWLQRAEAAIANANYKERADVRARRIKGLEADKRSQERDKAHAEKCLKFWTGQMKMKTGEPFQLTRNLALSCCNVLDNHLSFCFTLARYPRTINTYEGHMSLWSALGGTEGEAEAIITPEQARDLAVPHHERVIVYCNRWIAHIDNRLAYERAMLGEAGGIAADKTGPEVGGACKCWTSHRDCMSYIKKVNKVSVTVWNNWGNGGKNFTRTIPFDKLTKLMTAAEVRAARESGTLRETADGTGFAIVEEKAEA